MAFFAEKGIELDEALKRLKRADELLLQPAMLPLAVRVDIKRQLHNVNCNLCVLEMAYQRLHLCLLALPVQQLLACASSEPTTAQTR